MEPVLDTSTVPTAPPAPPAPIEIPLAGAPAAAPAADPKPVDPKAAVEIPGQTITPDKNTPVSTDAPPKSDEEDNMALLMELLGITPDTDPAKAKEAATADPAKEGDEFSNPNSEPEIFRKEIESWKGKYTEAAPKLETLDKLQKAIDADPMLKAIVDQKLAGKDIELSKVVREFLTKRLGATPKTETAAPAGTAAKPKTLQQMIQQGGQGGLTLAPTRG